MAKFLHFADIHLDTRFQYLDAEKNALRKEELRSVVSRIVRLAVDENVDVVFIAGDLFEGLNSTAESIEMISREMENAKHIRFFLCSGNHDPYTPSSQYALMKLPPNAHLFKSVKFERVVLEDLKMVVYGAGFEAPTCAASLMTEFSLNTDDPADFARVCVIHGDLNQNSPYNYISQSDIEKSGLDYLALGHVHAMSINKRGNTTYAYPGVPEGKGFDECGEKGVLIGEVSRGNVKLRFETTDYRRFFVKQFDVTGCTDIDGVIKLIKTAVFDNPKVYFYKIVLKGEVDFEIDSQQILSEISDDFFFVKLNDETTALIEESELSDESLKGIFLTKIDGILSDCLDEKQKQLVTLAKNYGISALERRDIKI